MNRTTTVDMCLEEIERIKRERDRAIAQRCAMEATLWRSEWLLKKVVQGTRIDVVEIEAFLAEPRWHPSSPGEAVKTQGEGVGSASSGTGEVPHVDI